MFGVCGVSYFFTLKVCYNMCRLLYLFENNLKQQKQKLVIPQFTVSIICPKLVNVEHSAQVRIQISKCRSWSCPFVQAYTSSRKETEVRSDLILPMVCYRPQENPKSQYQNEGMLDKEIY